MKDVTKLKQTEMEAGLWRKGVSAYLQRPSSPLPGFSHFFTLLLLWTLHQQRMWEFVVLEIRLNNQLSLWCI